MFFNSFINGDKMDLSKVYSCVDVLNVMKPYGLEYVYDRELFSGIDKLFESMDYLDKSGYIESRNLKSIDGIWSFGGATLTVKGFNYVNS